MKTVKVDHVILTLGFSASAIANGAGMAKDVVNKMVNDRLAEGYDEVKIFPLKSNFSDSLQLESVVNEYIFYKYAEDAAPAKAKKE